MAVMSDERNNSTAQRMETVRSQRSFLQYVLLSFVTGSVYHYFFLNSWANDVNRVCADDGRHTVGVGQMMLFSVLTLGVYKYLWLAGLLDRVCDAAAEYDVEARQDGEAFFLWVILVPVLGYFIAMALAIRETNRLMAAYCAGQKHHAAAPERPAVQRPLPEKQGALYGLTGSLAGMKIELTPGQTLRLGRNPTEADVIVEGEKISRVHCTLQYHGAGLGYSLTDHSRNGVIVNGTRIAAGVRTYVPTDSVIALADGANKFELTETEWGTQR